MDSYNAILDYLYKRLPMFQRSGPPAYKNSLDNTLKLDKLYNHPHRNYKTIHVAGTNGKGSVSHMLAAILQKAGYKTGLYTSPHLKDFRERIRIDGKKIPEEEIVRWVGKFMEKNRKLKLEPSFFELTATMAFDYFSQQNVDIAVIEVGLGGRLDSTNIISPELSIITNIGMDHTNLLGNTLEDIAGEKAGIIKKQVPVIIGKYQQEIKHVFIDKALKENAPIYFAGKELSIDYSMLTPEGKQVFNIRKGETLIYPNLKTGLCGSYQRENIVTVLKASEILKSREWNISEEDIFCGLDEVVETTGIMGRWQHIGFNPRIICDTGHNEDGIGAVVEQLKQTPYKKLHIVFGTVRDKSPDKILQLLPTEAEYYFTNAKIPRAMEGRVLAEFAAKYGLKGKVFTSVEAALEAARKSANPEDLIYVGGSTFVVAEILL